MLNLCLHVAKALAERVIQNKVTEKDAIFNLMLLKVLVSHSLVRSH